MPKTSKDKTPYWIFGLSSLQVSKMRKSGVDIIRDGKQEVVERGSYDYFYPAKNAEEKAEHERQWNRLQSVLLRIKAKEFRGPTESSMLAFIVHDDNMLEYAGRLSGTSAKPTKEKFKINEKNDDEIEE